MDYENFKENLIEGIKEDLYHRGYEDITIKEQDMVNKINGGYDGIVITPADSNIGVTLNANTLYAAFEDGAPLDAVIDKAVRSAVEGIENQPQVDVAALTDYSQMKDKLVMEVVSTETNAEMLQNIPHVEIEDMSVVYRFMLDSNEMGRASILVTNNLMETMGITAEQLNADAMENAPKLKPAVITGMTEILSEMTGLSIEELSMMGLPTDPAMEQMYVASVPDKMNGAGIIAYQDFMDKAAEVAGKGEPTDIFIIPSSRHEIIVVPDNGDMRLEDLKDMVKTVNATEVSPQDKLTDSVYHYDAHDKIFELGEKFVARQAEKEAKGREGKEIGDLGAEKSEKSEAKDSVLGDLKAKRDEVAKAPKKEPKEKLAGKNKGGEAI